MTCTSFPLAAMAMLLAATMAAFSAALSSDLAFWSGAALGSPDKTVEAAQDELVGLISARGRRPDETGRLRNSGVWQDYDSPSAKIPNGWLIITYLRIQAELRLPVDLSHGSPHPKINQHNLNC